MKDVLEYTKEELESMSSEELEVLLRESESMEDRYDVSQKVKKTLINGLYGSLANKWFSMFNEDMAAAITGNGRYFIQKLARYIEAELQKLMPSDKPYIVYGDTDSVYYHIEPFMEKIERENPDKSFIELVDLANTFEEKVIQPVIQKTISDFANELNAYDEKIIGAEREVIADSGVFTAKKKYYLRVRDNEGTRYPEDSPYIKVMGLEIIKSSTPKWSQGKLKSSIPLILDKDASALTSWIDEIKQDFIKTDLNNIASVSSVSNLNYVLGVNKGIPIGSRAAIAHNNYIKVNELEEQYNLIAEGDKTKRLFLTMPNPFDSDIVAFTNDNFVEELAPYVDYDTNFEKGFLKPLEIMTNALNWNLRQQTEELDEW